MSNSLPRAERSKALSWALRIMLLTAVFAIFFVLVQSCSSKKDDLHKFAKDSLKKLVVLSPPPAQPSLALKTIDGADVYLKDFHGKVILVNVWATWCGPCVLEMPSLEQFQGAYGGDQFEVVAVNMDIEAVDGESFYATHEFTNLKFYHDPSLGMSGKLGVSGLPISVFYDASGREIARIPGPVEWQSAEVKALMSELLHQ